MNVLILGSGGREHALAWKIAQSKHLDQLFVAPGNAGTIHAGINVDLKPGDFESVGEFVADQHIGMVVVGSEAPLVEGIRDYFDRDERFKDVSVIGPSQDGAMLEGSKDFAKEFMSRHNIPTAAYKTFAAGETEQGHRFLDTLRPPYVLKADGLAAGKGVIISPDPQEARDMLTEMLDNARFGEASSKVVIEEFLEGIEISVFVLTDGKNYVLLPEAKDYKRIGEGDTGKNTGGMGSVSPVPFADEPFMKKVEDRIIRPTIEGLHKENILYQGFIFFGLMNVNGDPYVIEYNCRMGDPETEAVMPRIKSDFLELLMAVKDQQLDKHTIQFDERHAASVFLVSGGYPDAYEKKKKITGLDRVNDSIVFHAGTNLVDDDVITTGGRVLAITSLGQSLDEALEISYRNAKVVDFDKKNFRSDLGQDLLSL